MIMDTNKPRADDDMRSGIIRRTGKRKKNFERKATTIKRVLTRHVSVPNFPFSFCFTRFKVNHGCRLLPQHAIKCNHTCLTMDRNVLSHVEKVTQIQHGLVRFSDFVTIECEVKID